jgi:hypothetical protein
LRPGAVDLAPLVEQLKDLGFLFRAQPVHRVAAGRSVDEPVGGPSGAPPPRAGLFQLQALAGAPVAPTVLDSPVDQLQQPSLDGRVDPARDPAA